MLFPLIETEEWSKRYRIKNEMVSCLKCKKSIEADVPVAIKDYRGFRTREHGCPQEYHQYILTPVDSRVRDSLIANSRSSSTLNASF